MKNIENIIIDIGSNTVKVLILDKNNTIINNINKVISLALDFKNDTIDKEAIKRLKDFLYDIKNYLIKAKNIKCVATAIFRQSKNAKVIADEIEKEFGFKVYIINAYLEALLVKKALCNYGFNDSLIIDVGGASTEFIVDDFSKSFDFGIVSLYNHTKTTKDISKQDKKAFKKIIHKKIIKNDYKALQTAINLTKEARLYLENKKFKNIVLCSKICIYNKSIEDKIPYKLVDESKYLNTKISLKKLINGARKLARMHKNRASFYIGDDRQVFLVYGVFLLLGMFYKKSNISFICFDDALKYGLIHQQLDDEFYSNCLNL